ncbi:MAG TPA: beta-galactosidase [Streptosporangiaceae bacterium]
MIPSGFAYGGDYNPEQWPPETWAEDMRLMREAGVNLVTLGIFGWAQIERTPGTYEWGWFDQVMDLLAENGIAVCLATMTASPPPWMARAHPETLPVRADGTVLAPGARQHYTPSSAVYRRYATRFVEALATRYAAHPALAMWHVGNEYGCHVAESYGPVDAVAFREWLRDRYGGLDALNDAWSTAFWSQRYSAWEEIEPPRTAPTFGNPAQRIDYRRFSSDALLGCYLAERAVLRRVTPDVPVTTNFFPLGNPALDMHAWAAEEDVVSYDSYPDPADPEAHIGAAFAYDLMRSLKGGAPWMLIEQAPSAVNWRQVNRPKAPGRMRLGSWQAVAHGADAVLFFQWRASRGGAEKFHSAMVPHAGPDSRTFSEVRELGRELADHAGLAGSRVRARAALVLDWPSWWALEQPSHPSTRLRQMEAALSHYTPLWRANITCDVVHPEADLTPYALVILPNLYLLDEGAAANLTRFTESGGHLLASFFTAVADKNDRIHPGGPPGPLAPVLGLHTTEFWPLAKGETVDLEPPAPAGAAHAPPPPIASGEGAGAASSPPQPHASEGEGARVAPQPLASGNEGERVASFGGGAAGAVPAPPQPRASGGQGARVASTPPPASGGDAGAAAPPPPSASGGERAGVASSGGGAAGAAPAPPPPLASGGEGARVASQPLASGDEGERVASFGGGAAGATPAPPQPLASGGEGAGVASSGGGAAGAAPAPPPPLASGNEGAGVASFGGGAAGVPPSPPPLFELAGGHGALWSEEMRLEGAVPLVVFGSGGAEGEAAFTRHGYGAGVAYYLATRPDPATMRTLMEYVCAEAGVAPAVGGLPENTEAVVREGADGTRYAVILDHDTAEVTVRPA